MKLLILNLDHIFIILLSPVSQPSIDVLRDQSKLLIQNDIKSTSILDGQSQSSSKLIHIAVYEDKHIDSIFQIQIPVNIGADDNCQQITDLDKSSIIDELVLNLKSIEVEKPISVSIENVYHEHTHQVLYIICTLSINNKVGFVFSMVVWRDFRMWQHKDDEFGKTHSTL